MYGCIYEHIKDEYALCWRAVLDFLTHNFIKSGFTIDAFRMFVRRCSYICILDCDKLRFLNVRYWYWEIDMKTYSGRNRLTKNRILKPIAELFHSSQICNNPYGAHRTRGELHPYNVESLQSVNATDYPRCIDSINSFSQQTAIE